MATGSHEQYPAETEESERAHLPQPFLHGLPTSSLEPGTTNLDRPLTYVFLESSLEESQSHGTCPPLRLQLISSTRLRISATLWEN